MPTSPLDAAAIQAFMAAHPDWQVEHEALVRTFDFASFPQAIRFVHNLGQLAEAADHHPDIDIRWKRVTVRFTTHDAGHRISALDTRLAHEAELVARTTA